jgi:DNA repair protein RecN (Recombination protein N)
VSERITFKPDPRLMGAFRFRALVVSAALSSACGAPAAAAAFAVVGLWSTSGGSGGRWLGGGGCRGSISSGMRLQSVNQQATSGSSSSSSSSSMGTAVGSDAMLDAEDGACGCSYIESLEVENLLMVRSARIDLRPGLVAITGETGAGKSLISGALTMAAGARVRGSDMAGAAGEEARIRVTLHLSQPHRSAVSAVLRRLRLPPLLGGFRLEVERRLGGRAGSATAQCSVNGAATRVTPLREVVGPLIHSVNPNAVEVFGRADSRRRVLDRLLTGPERELIGKVGKAVANLRKAEAWVVHLSSRGKAADGKSVKDAQGLLEHWVQELDEFEGSESTFTERVRASIEEFVDDYGEDSLGSGGAELAGLLFDEGDRQGSSSLSYAWSVHSALADACATADSASEQLARALELASSKASVESLPLGTNKVRDLLIAVQSEACGIPSDMLEPAHNALNSIDDALRVVASHIERAASALPPLPVTPEEMEMREARWRELARKHRVNPIALGTMHDELRRELDSLVSAAEALPEAEAELAEAHKEAQALAADLHEARLEAAGELEDRINPLLPEVGMQGSTFHVLVEDTGVLTAGGGDKIVFMLGGGGRGRAPMPIDAAGSSGEKSRLLLLLEACLPPPGGLNSELSDSLIPPCAILYDEIDAHVGGRAAVAVGRLLANQGTSRQVGILSFILHASAHTEVSPCLPLCAQVLVVTHTAPVAAQADQHLLVDKVMGSDDVSVSINEVLGQDREAEVARMAAGGMGGQSASELARLMLQPRNDAFDGP